MSEIQKVARVEIEFDAQGLEDDWIEFELEGEKWVGFSTQRIHPETRQLAKTIKALQEEYGWTFEQACQIKGVR